MSSNICFKRKGRQNTIYKYCVEKINLSKDILIDENDILNEGSYSVILGGMKDQTQIVAKFTPLDVSIPSLECGLNTDSNCKIYTTKEFNQEKRFFQKFGGLPNIPNVYFAEILDVSDYKALRGNVPKDSLLLRGPKKIGVIIMDRFVSSDKDVKLKNENRIQLVDAAIGNFKLRNIRDRIDAESSYYDEEVLNREIDLIEIQDPICTKQLSKLISSQAYKLNFEILSNLLHKQFYNVDIMKTMQCVLYSLVNDEVSYYELMKTTEVLRKSDKPNFIIFFQNLFTGKNKIFSTKYEGFKTLHETVIGLKAVNKVREVLPTFIWTYGITPCNMPILNSKGHKMITGCTRPVNYKNDDYIGMITEYIEGESLGSFIKNKKLTEGYLYSIILSVLYSLKYAHEMTGFIHWDLHTDNIQMRTLDNDDYYIYLPNEKKYLWVGGHLSTIFDFGFSSMKMDGETYGNFEFIECGLNPNVNYSIQNDILKLFVNLYSLTRNNPIIESKFDIIYKYFLQFDKIKEVDELDYVLKKNYGIFPNGMIYNINSFTNITIDDVIKFVENMIPNELSYLIETKQPGRILSCNDGKCLSEVQIYEELFKSSPVDNMITVDLKDIYPRDVPDVKMILDNYLDVIFNSISYYQNKPLKESTNIILDFNSFRITQEKLNKIERFTQGIKGLEEVNKRVKQIKETINALIDKYYVVANKSISDPKFVSNIDIDAPEDQIDPQIDFLKELFQKSRV